MKQNGLEVYECLMKKGGHFYVCGDVEMANDVTATLNKLLQQFGKLTQEEAKHFLIKLRVSSNP